MAVKTEGEDRHDEVGFVDHNDLDWAAWRRLFQKQATNQYRYVA